MGETLTATLNGTFLNRPVLSLIAAALTFLLIVTVVPFVRGHIRKRWTQATGLGHVWKMLVAKFNAKWYRTTTVVVAIVIASTILAPEPRIEHALRVLLVVMLAIQAWGLIPVLIDLGISRVAGNAADPKTSSTAATLTGLRWVGLFVAYSLILLLALQNVGVDVTAMVAGLGIGGIAIALAVQNILGDLFASLTIALDKPFVAGDFIIVGSEMGAVENVGLKTTRVRSLSGEQLVFANSDLLTSRIRNYKRMQERRVVLAFGVVYSTPPDVLEKIPMLVRSAIEAHEGLRFDRSHFFRFGDSSLDFETVYYISTPDYNAHMNAQQAVLMRIVRAFHERGIDFAFPTQTLYFAGRDKARESAGTTTESRDSAEVQEVPR